MKNHQTDSSFALEELMCRLQIHERTISDIRRDIYENIGQVLSLARLKLISLDVNEPVKVGQETKSSGTLVLKAIRDLRKIANQLSPDDIERKGFLSSLELEIEKLNSYDEYNIQVLTFGDYYTLEPSRELILFCIIQNILYENILHSHRKKTNILIRYKPRVLQIDINYDHPEEMICLSEPSLMVKRKISTVKGSWKTTISSGNKKLSLLIKK